MFETSASAELFLSLASAKLFSSLASASKGGGSVERAGVWGRVGDGSQAVWVASSAADQRSR